MNSQNERRFSVTYVFGAIVALLYFAGYGMIRARCEAVIEGYCVVPSYVVDQNNNRTVPHSIYKPLFFVESHLRGKKFIWSPWSMQPL